MFHDTSRLHEHLPVLEQHKTWVEIDASALRDNYRALKSAVLRVRPQARMIAVVKADAYGHGIEPCLTTLLEEGCRDFAVSGIEEAMAIRHIVRTLRPLWSDEALNLLILGYVLPSQAVFLAKYAITATVLSLDYACALSAAAVAAGVCLPVHIALDTGMNRIGLSVHSRRSAKEAAEAILEIRRLPGLRITGMFTHFARADEEEAEVLSEAHPTMEQYRRYNWVLNELTARGFRPPLCHVCNSAAAQHFASGFPEGCLDAVRLGIMLYGVRPSPQVPTALRSVMKLKTLVSHVHRLEAGATVSYGGHFCAKDNRAHMIATLPIGYADGFLRAYEGASVRIHTAEGTRTAPLVGRICMDQCMVDVTDLQVRVGDVVTLFGDTPQQLMDLARRANTIEYELLCLVSARVPRIAAPPSSHHEENIL